MNLPTDTICDMSEHSEEAQNFSEISSESEEETVSSGSISRSSADQLVVKFKLSSLSVSLIKWFSAKSSRVT
jgi:hypothetical protein